MKRVLDARNKQCPIPVIMAKEAMLEVNEIEIMVDNEIAVQNLHKLAKQKQYHIQSEKKNDVFLVQMANTLNMSLKKQKKKLLYKKRKRLFVMLMDVVFVLW